MKNDNPKDLAQTKTPYLPLHIPSSSVSQESCPSDRGASKPIPTDQIDHLELIRLRRQVEEDRLTIKALREALEQSKGSTVESPRTREAYTGLQHKMKAMKDMYEDKLH